MLTPSRMPRSRFKLAVSSAAVGFVAGAFAMAALVVIGDRRAKPPPAGGNAPAGTVAPAGTIQPAEPMRPPAVSPPPEPSPDAAPVLHADPGPDLRQRNLELPVLGADRSTLHDSFDEARGGSRKHEAIDILAPRNTPVVAVENGSVAKLFRSDAGGITVYLFDQNGQYAEAIVNTPGATDQLIAITIPVDGVYLIKVQSDGEWTVEVQQ